MKFHKKTSGATCATLSASLVLALGALLSGGASAAEDYWPGLAGSETGRSGKRLPATEEVARQAQGGLESKSGNRVWFAARRQGKSLATCTRGRGRGHSLPRPRDGQVAMEPTLPYPFQNRWRGGSSRQGTQVVAGLCRRPSVRHEHHRHPLRLGRRHGKSSLEELARQTLQGPPPLLGIIELPHRRRQPRNRSLRQR